MGVTSKDVPKIDNDNFGPPWKGLSHTLITRDSDIECLTNTGTDQGKPHGVIFSVFLETSLNASSSQIRTEINVVSFSGF